MTIGDALFMAALMSPFYAPLIALRWLWHRENVEKLRIRADLLKAGIDPDRLDKEAK